MRVASVTHVYLSGIKQLAVRTGWTLRPGCSEPLGALERNRPGGGPGRIRIVVRAGADLEPNHRLADAEHDERARLGAPPLLGGVAMLATATSDAPGKTARLTAFGLTPGITARV